MRLLDVSAVLDRERDTQPTGLKISVLEQLDDKTAKYAILSHRWGKEVDYDELAGLVKMFMDEQDRDEVRQRDGYQKIIKSCEQAEKDGYRWLWIDTCCINKDSSAELSEAINSMYQWYRNSQICYVYLNDVDKLVFPTEQDFSRFGRSNGWPEWFSRGWTLQELIAPTEIKFFNKNWVPIGTKQDLISTLEEITGIPEEVLNDEQVLRSTRLLRPSVAQIMSWAADRKTSRVEDRAYSLMGLFGVNMPMLYGEGSKAFQRLQLEIIRVSSDHSIFAWNPKGQLGEHGSVLADDPSCFRGCHSIETVYPYNFVHILGGYMRRDLLGRVLDSASLVWLRQRVRSLQLRHSLQLCRWDVTNLGIQAVLPCHDRDGDLITIDLESRGHSSYRWSCPARIDILNTSPEFRSLYFAYTQDAVKSYHHLRLHDRRASWHGFTRCGTFPREITDNTVTLSSQGNTLIILVYANNDARSRFAVGLGYYLGSVWARVVCDQYPANQGVWTSCADFAKQAYDILWNAPIEKFYFLSHTDHVMDTHLPQSVWDARIVCGSSYQGYADVMIAIEQCPGCCFGPRQPTTSANALWLPWAQGRADVGHELELDERSACFRECSGESTALGDYGDLSDGNFKHCGNIFEDIQKHSGIESTDLVYHPVVSRVSSCRRVSHSRRAQTQHDILVTVPIKHFVNKQGNAEPTLKPLVLYRPKGLSLPNSEEFELLLKALSTRLAGKCLVTTVVQCSESYRVDDEGMQMDAGGDSALDGGVRSDQGTITSLCIIARPLAWRKEPACAERRKQFKNIRNLGNIFMPWRICIIFLRLGRLRNLRETSRRRMEQSASQPCLVWNA
ncbi:heterokaryon incompatibility protein-domain-containing protein [Pisolithus marmoratus]|nr:heterokaryon incompatibility protein-domain-containing protein [Pisolithus marmoratus]